MDTLTAWFLLLTRISRPRLGQFQMLYFFHASVRDCVCPCVWDRMFLRYLQYLSMDFHQSVIIVAPCDKHELIKLCIQKVKVTLSRQRLHSTQRCSWVQLSSYTSLVDRLWCFIAQGTLLGSRVFLRNTGWSKKLAQNFLYALLYQILTDLQNYFSQNEEKICNNTNVTWRRLGCVNLAY